MKWGMLVTPGKERVLLLAVGVPSVGVAVLKS